MGKSLADLERENIELKKALEEKEATQKALGDITPSEVVKTIEENAVLKRTVEEQAEVQAELTRQIGEMGKTEMRIVNGVVDGTAIMVMTPDEYADYSKQNGRVMGRVAGTKTVCSIEELRALINSNWTPSMVMEKHGISADELQQLVWQLSLKELRDKPIKYDIKRDFFSKEG